ncbi:MAG: hypothetical protein ACLFOC_11355 [Campylobacterales bacterium]
MAEKSDKRALIIRDRSAKIRINKGSIEIDAIKGSFVVGLNQIGGIYLHKDVSLSMADVFALSRHSEVSLIDARGNILGQFRRLKYE